MNIALRYGLAVVIVGAAFVLRVLLEPFTGTGAPFLLFFGATLVAGYLLGRGPGLLAVALSAPLGAYYFVLRAKYPLSQAVLQALLFTIEGTLMTTLAAGFVSAKRRADRKATDAERAKEAKEHLLAAVSHDLKNPLSAIDMRSSLIETSTEIAFIHREATAIRRNIKSLVQLIDSLVLLGKIEANAFQIETEPCASKTLITEVIELLMPAALAKSITLNRKDLQDLKFVGNHVRLLEVLSNLIGNAIKFTAEGGTVEVEVRSVDHQVEFSVRDTGPGIPEAQQPFVFDRYWQAKQTARYGSGLGLAISKGIVNALGGEIEVKSAVGTGSTFSFKLPAAA